MIEVKSLSKRYWLGQQEFYAVHRVDLALRPGEILGLVGESGSGKTTLGKMILGLIPPTTGRIFFQGREVTHKRDKSFCQNVQMVFQDPYASLNPRMTVGELIQEPMRIHLLPNRVDELLDFVSLPRETKRRYPHELSGGQRQRVGIARAISLNPKVLICDEPISALDVSIQAQIINLLLHLQRELGLSYLFISHDLAMVQRISDRIAVMYRGEIVEEGPAQEVLDSPQHPYTQLLLASSPRL